MYQNKYNLLSYVFKLKISALVVKHMGVAEKVYNNVITLTMQCCSIFVLCVTCSLICYCFISKSSFATQIHPTLFLILLMITKKLKINRI